MKGQVILSPNVNMAGQIMISIQLTGENRGECKYVYGQSVDETPDFFDIKPQSVHKD